MKRVTENIIIGSALLIAVADSLFKWLAISNFPSDGIKASWPIDFLLHKNPGIAFDLPVPLWIVITFTLVISFFLLRFALIQQSANHEAAIAAVIIVIGALGNMFDRIFNGFTTDYIILFSRSAINLSDILIIAGAILLIRYTRK